MPSGERLRRAAVKRKARVRWGATARDRGTQPSNGGCHGGELPVQLALLESAPDGRANL